MASPGEDFGWRVHGALDFWTGRVDTKASIALAIEGATFGFVVSLSDDNRRFDRLSGLANTTFVAGLVLLLAALLLSALVVMPRLRRRQSRSDWHGQMIYFGHLRHWDTAALKQALDENAPATDQLAAQLVVMSKIAWRKHAQLQLSLLLFLAADFCLITAGATA